MRAALRSTAWTSLELLYRAYVGVSMSVLSRVDFGTNVLDRDWDVLVVLDTARVDAMRDVAGEFDFIEEVRSVRSLGSTSSEWIAKTFTSEHRETLADTVLVSANPHVQHTLYDREFPEHDKDAFFSWTDWDTVGPDAFLHVDQPWQYATDERYGHVLPRDVTERAVALHREFDPGRMIVHYMNPHRPHVSRAIAEDRDLTDAERDPFAYLTHGGDRDRVYRNHVADLAFVLREGVAPLLENVDADTVAVTADHGDGFGEWWCYAHAAGDPRPTVRRVPWVTMPATDRGTLRPELSPPDDVGEDTEARLEALGYR